MPDPQVDEGGFYSKAATMPALGYAIPNQAPAPSAPDPKAQP
jgi:hypothetical protein